MIEQFEIISYKGLCGFSVDSLRRVNIVTGENGIGKTSLLEALWLFHGRYNPSLLWNPHVQRRAIQGANPITQLGGVPVHLRGSEDGSTSEVQFEFQEVIQALQQPVNGTPRQDGWNQNSQDNVVGNTSGEPLSIPMLGKLKVSYDNDPHLSSYESEVVLSPVGPALSRPHNKARVNSAVLLTINASSPVSADTVERFSQVVAQGKKKDLLDTARLIKPEIKDIEILSHSGIPSLWANTSAPNLLPLEALGGGLVRLFALVTSFFATQGGLILIDEIENGIHYSALPELWQQIRRLAEELDVQVVATTHSDECVRAAVMQKNVEDHAPSDFSLHQMYMTKDGSRKSQTYSDDVLMAALDLGLGVR